MEWSKPVNQRPMISRIPCDRRLQLNLEVYVSTHLTRQRLTKAAAALLIVVASTCFHASGFAAQSQQTGASSDRDLIEEYKRGIFPGDRAEFEQKWSSATPAERASILDEIRSSSRTIGPYPLYDGDIPNSKPAPDGEIRNLGDDVAIRKVSRPTYTAYLPDASRASGAAVVILPGGGYGQLGWSGEGIRTAEEFQDRGIVAILVKYRLPSDETMIDKSIGPLQDAQQALRLVRQNAKAWRIDPAKIGVIGFSAGGHLASTVGTHFDQVLVPNPDGVSVRPDFMILVYPLISMLPDKMDIGSHDRLLGPQASSEKVKRFSNELQVTTKTPPALLIAAEGDTTVDVNNSISFFEALRRNGIPAELVVFPQGEHGFFLPREQMLAPMWAWLAKNGWLKP